MNINKQINCFIQSIIYNHSIVSTILRTINYFIVNLPSA